MKKIFLYITFLFLSLPIISFAEEDYLFDSFENSADKSQIEFIKDEKTRICEWIYLEVMYRRNFTKQEVKLCKHIFIKKIKDEIDYKRKVMWDRYVY